MNIIILGAGQVGSTVATQLSKEESNELTVIDINQQILSDLQDHLDLRTICGNGSYPNMLENAGADGLNWNRVDDLIIRITLWLTDLPAIDEPEREVLCSRRRGEYSHTDQYA